MHRKGINIWQILLITLDALFFICTSLFLSMLNNIQFRTIQLSPGKSIFLKIDLTFCLTELLLDVNEGINQQ